MTYEELEQYITKNLPSFRKKYIYYDNDEEVLQQVLLDILRKHDQLIVKNDDTFTGLMLQYYNQIRTRRFVQRFRRDEEKQVLLQEHSYIAHDEYPYAESYNPWCNNRTEVTEYIELLTDKRMKTIMQQHYILGMTYEEIGTEHSISHEMVRKVIRQGVQVIKEAIQ